MKKLLILLLALVMVLGLMAACDQAPSTNAPDTTPSSTPTEPQYEVITIAQALELCGEPGNKTEERYYIRGTIVSIDNANYGAMTIQDETGTISIYGTYSADGAINYSAMTDKPYKGDEVLLHCILQNYNGTKEVQNARLIEFKRADIQINEADYTEMTVSNAEADALAEYGEQIRALGFDFTVTPQTAASQKASITQIPGELSQDEAAVLFTTLISRLSDVTASVESAAAEFFESRLWQASCKAAIKGGRIYDTAHIKWICDRLLVKPSGGTGSVIRTCPHGRPVAFEIRKTSIERQFERG